MSYRSLGVIAILFSAVPTLQGMKHLHKIQAICNAIKHNNPTLQYLSGVYNKKDNASVQKEPKKQLKKEIVEIPFGESVTISSSSGEDYNKVHAIRTLQDDRAIVTTFIKKPDDTQYANIAYGKLGNCGLHCMLLKNSAAFLKEHGQENDWVKHFVVVPGVYQQRGAHYRLVPSAQAMHHCYDDLFGLPGQSHNIKKLDINSLEELEEAVMNPPIRTFTPLACERLSEQIDAMNFSVMVYDPKIIALKKRYHIDWGIRFDKKGNMLLTKGWGLEEYPALSFKGDYLRWLCKSMEKEQKRREDKKDAHYYFFELMKAQEGFNQVIARIKQDKAQDPKALAILDHGKKKEDQRGQALSWWLFKNL